jgi:hypothetical protein
MLSLLFGLGLSFKAIAQQNQAQAERPLSPSVVLVLKLVTKTDVIPTTGIVISNDGLILVPSSLVTNPGEIVVLDNGVDIAVNGRPAVIVDKPLSGGLALISVEGLERPGITLSENALEAGQSLHLETFPPPKLMAKGAKPLWVPVEIAPQNSNMRAALSAHTPLPFITGPIIDDCGYFAGLSLALGPSSMDLDKLPIVAFTDELGQIFDAMEISLPTAPCQATTPAETTLATAENESATDPGSLSAEENNELPIEPESANEEVTLPVEDSPTSGAPAEKLRSVPITKPPSIWRSIPAWLVLLGWVILGVLVWKGTFLLRLRKNPAAQRAGGRSIGDKPVAADEPDTDQLDMKSAQSALRPRSAPLEADTTPDMSALPPGCDAVVMIDGLFAADQPFTRYCAVDRNNIDIVFGTGAADISIEHPTVSRRHARLVCSPNSMTFSDLGSSDGTFINGTPCLPGEIMFIEAGDELFLGQLKLSIIIASTQEQLT